MSERGSRRGIIEALAAELQIDAPDQVLHDLQEFYREVDAEVQARSRGLDLPCREGCDACCKESVFLSAPEFLGVAQHLADTWGAAELEELLFRMNALADRFEDELELLETIPAGRERDEVAARIKFDCPFLFGGACRIYSVRELNARTFGASWDGRTGESYGCELTKGRLRVLPDSVGPSLADARELRARLAARFPSTEHVHVYPWWFRRHQKILAQLPTALAT